MIRKDGPTDVGALSHLLWLVLPHQRAPQQHGSSSTMSLPRPPRSKQNWGRGLSHVRVTCMNPFGVRTSLLAHIACHLCSNLARISGNFHIDFTWLLHTSHKRSSITRALTPAPSTLRGASSPTTSSTLRMGLRSRLTALAGPIRRRNLAWSPGPSLNPRPGWIARSVSSPCLVVALGTPGTAGPGLIGLPFAHSMAGRLAGRHPCPRGGGLEVNFWQQPCVSMSPPTIKRKAMPPCTITLPCPVRMKQGFPVG